MKDRVIDKKGIILAVITLTIMIFALGCRNTSVPAVGTPSVTPGMVPGTNPGSNPGTNPGGQGGSLPGAIPTAEPTATPIPTPTPIVDMPLDRVTAETISRSAAEEGEMVVSGPSVWVKLNPFYSTEEKELEIVDMTQIRLFDTDEEGNIYTGIDWPGYAYSVVKTGTISADGTYTARTDAEINADLAAAREAAENAAKKAADEAEALDPSGDDASDGEGSGDSAEEAGEAAADDNAGEAAADDTAGEADADADTGDAETVKEKTYDVYTIVLKEGLTFADGTPITPEDAIFSIYTLSDVGYKGVMGLGGLDIYGMRAYSTQVPEPVRADAARALAAGIAEDGTCPEGFEEKELWNDVWSNFDEGGVAFVNDIIESVMNNPRLALNGPVQAFLSSYLTFDHIKASKSMQVLYAMTINGFVRSYNYSKNTMRDCLDVVHDLSAEELTPELFWDIIKQYYNYNLSDETGINYERGYSDRRLEDYIADAYCSKHLGVEAIEGIKVSEAAFEEDAARPCIEVTIASDADISEFNFYVAEKSVYGKKPSRSDVLTGAGRYTLVSNDENGALLEANANYMLGVEKQKYIRFVIDSEDEEGEGASDPE